MAITAAMVKELRERTGAGMMECKKALTETGGDIEAAVESLRKKGAAKADKKAGRIAAEGAIASANTASAAVLVEVNCETDFVAKDGQFLAFASAVANTVLAQRPNSVEALMQLSLDGSAQTVEEARVELFGKIGENIAVRRFSVLEVSADGHLGVYLHGKRIGVMVAVDGGSGDLARDIAMHVAASRPLCVSADDVPSEIVEKEREIYTTQAHDSGKPANIIEKIVEGRVQKYLKENTLLGQPFVKDSDRSVEDLLSAEEATVTGFVRFEVGEGLEKKTDDFVAEVMAQAKGG